jgi:hypothetical protein
MGEGMFPGEGGNAFLGLYIIVAIVCAFFWVPELGWLLGIIKSIFWGFVVLWKILLWLWGILF